jgi:hypothetical protein
VLAKQKLTRAQSSEKARMTLGLEFGLMSL